MKAHENKDAIYISQQEAIKKAKEINHLKRTEMQASSLLVNVKGKNVMTPDMRELLEASLTLQTTSAKALAAHLHCSPATVRANYQRILTILGDRGR